MANLQTFFSTFNSNNYVSTIDTQNSFECYFEFFPDKKDKNGLRKEMGNQKKGFFESLINNTIGGVKQAAKNAVNNITGGLASSFTDDVDIKKEHKKFKTKGKCSFLEYLIEANMLVTMNGCPMQLSLGPYIQKLTIPNLKVETVGVDTLIGQFQTVKQYGVTPDSNTLTMEVLNTKAPLIERIFHPWMREQTLPYWSYETQPYTTARITVDMSKHCDIKYVFYGCRPTQLMTYDPSNELPSNFTRQVTITFDFMIVESSLKTVDSVKDKLKDSALKLLGGASKLL